MVVGSGAGVVPPTTSKALGTLLWVLGGRGDLSQVIHWSLLKVARGYCWGFGGVGKSNKMRKKSRKVALFFGIRVIEGTKTEISRT